MGDIFKRPTFTREITGIGTAPPLTIPSSTSPMGDIFNTPAVTLPGGQIPEQQTRTASYTGVAPGLAGIADFLTAIGGPQGWGSGIPGAQRQQQLRNIAPMQFFEQEQQMADVGTQRTLQMRQMQRQEQEDRFKFVDINGRKTLVDMSRLPEVQAGTLPPHGAFLTIEPDKLTPENVARETTKALRQFGIDEKQLTAEDRGTIHYGILEALRTGDYTPAQQAMNAVAGRHKAQQPRPAKVEYNQGIPVAVTDEKGVTHDINEPALPKPLKSLVSSAQAAHRQRVQESAEAAEMASRRIDERIEKKTLQTNQQYVFKLADAARTQDVFVQAAERMLAQVEKTGKISGPEANTFLASHIANTFGGGVKGIRIYKDLIERHVAARPFDQRIQAMVRSFTEGGFISKEQAKEWVALARGIRKDRWAAVLSSAEERGVDTSKIKVPKDISNAPTVKTFVPD